MPIPFSIAAILGTYPEIAVNKHKNFIIPFLYLIVGVGRVGIGIFCPKGEPISLQRLRCNPLEAVYDSFMSRFLALPLAFGWGGLALARE